MTEITIVDKYQQQYAHFGRMNDILYKLPPLFSTIIGALWFFAVSYIDKDRFISMFVFLFAAAWGIIRLTYHDRGPIFEVKRLRKPDQNKDQGGPNAKRRSC